MYTVHVFLTTSKYKIHLFVLPFDVWQRLWMKLSACIWSVYIVKLFFFLIGTKKHSQNDCLFNISLLQKHGKDSIITMVIYGMLLLTIF